MDNHSFWRLSMWYERDMTYQKTIVSQTFFSIVDVLIEEKGILVNNLCRSDGQKLTIIWNTWKREQKHIVTIYYID